MLLTVVWNGVRRCRWRWSTAAWRWCPPQCRTLHDTAADACRIELTVPPLAVTLSFT